MYPLFRLAGAVERDPAVAEWLASRPTELGFIARQWFDRMRKSGPDVCEVMHDGCPVVCVEDAPFCYVNAYRAHVNVGFFHGAALRDPSRLLLGDGKYMRNVKLKPGAILNESALDALIVAAYHDIAVRLKEVEPS